MTSSSISASAINVLQVWWKNNFAMWKMVNGTMLII